MNRSLRWPLVLSYVLLALLTVSLTGALGLTLVRRFLDQKEIEYLTANASAVAEQARPLISPMVRQDELQDLARTSSFLGNARVKVLDDRKQLLADSGAAVAERSFVWVLPSISRWASGAQGPYFFALPAGHEGAIPSLLSEEFSMLRFVPGEMELTRVQRMADAWGTRFHFESLGVPASRDLVKAATVTSDRELTGEPSERPPGVSRTVAVPIEQDGELIGYVEFDSALDFGSDALLAMRKAFLSAAGGAMLAALLLGLLVSQRLTAPLRQLTDAANQMGSGDLSARAKVRSRDETGRLATQFNAMADRLQNSFAELAAERDALRRFIADASHELRTPITALRSFNDLLRGAASEDASAREEFLAESQVQIDRLEWITSNLLDLSRLDAGLIDLALEQHPADEVILSATSGYQERAQEEGVSFKVLALPESLALDCDRARIELALSNLLDNAIKFTPPGGHVIVGAISDAQAVRIWVQDDGDGISPDDLPHIFDRFYRGQRSQAGGSGLGLSIARAIVEAHGGTVSVESKPSEGSRFIISLPLSPPTS